MDTREPGRIYPAGQPAGAAGMPAPSVSPGAPVRPGATGLTQPMPPAGSGWTQPLPPTPSAPGGPGLTQPMFAPKPSAPGVYSSGHNPVKATGVRLSNRSWLLPAAAGLLVVGVLAGVAMAAFGLSSAGGTTRAADRGPLPGSVAEVPAPVASTQPTQPTEPPSAAPTAPATPTKPALQQIPPLGTLHTASSQCLDVEKKDDGARARQHACNGAPEQHWQFAPLGNDQYMLVNQGTGKCLDVNGASKDDGATIQQWSCNNGGNQRWLIRRLGDAFTLVSINSGKCATVDNDRLKQQACGNDQSQRWAITA